MKLFPRSLTQNLLRSVSTLPAVTLFAAALSTACSGGNTDSSSPASAVPGGFMGTTNSSQPATNANANANNSTAAGCTVGTGSGTSCPQGQTCDAATATCVAGNSMSVNEMANTAATLDMSDDSNAADNSQPLLPCVPNQTWCNGDILNRCSRNGLAIDETQCPVCGDVGGVDGCIELSCEPATVGCAGPALVGTCSADGLELSTEPCPEGTICEGAGSCVAVQCNAQALDSFTGGESTVYWFGQGTLDIFGDISCGFGIVPGDLNNGSGDSVNGIANGELFGAMNTNDYQDAAACGACVDMEYQGRTVNITIVDECPIGSNATCTAGHIDLSRGAWNQLTGNAAGTQIFGVNWQFAPCETSGNITLQLKEPGDQYFNEILVRDHRYQVARVEVQLADNETWVDAQRQRYNYWTPPGGIMGNYRVRVTDINGAVIEEQLELTSGAQGGSSQFNCQ